MKLKQIKTYIIAIRVKKKFGRSGTEMNVAKNTAALTSSCAGGERNQVGKFKRQLTRIRTTQGYTRRTMGKRTWRKSILDGGWTILDVV